ncbi:coat protein [Lake Sarah-associated circular virus-36]|uniref:Coat protein n=1 Tax=Lake Sarah-associated circular virus-36 TaxID=1685764 RepID=A0A126GA55_9VIRU|nr:coat protein [Lake Sarah-associated circular virus-36]ALE29742.1 coat protein [Lake Sarah-associated circular virus-36]ALE29744.1 coat protein [Lake Sarah-associated circular virus-36]
MAMTGRKRVYGGKPCKNRFIKKRRMMARRRRSKKAVGLSTRTLAPTDFHTKGRMLKKRQWRNLLWRNTLTSEKYRSILMATTGLSTPGNHTTANWSDLEIMSNTQPFWTSAGGMQPVNQGSGVPTLAPDHIIIRGGTFYFSMINPLGNTTDIRVRLQLLYPKQNITRYASLVRTNVPLIDWITSLGGNQPTIWRMQDAGDYNQYYYNPVMEKEIILKPGDSFEEYRKMKVQRLDTEAFLNGAAGFPSWLVYISNLDGAAVQNVTVVSGHSLSFALADV